MEAGMGRKDEEEEEEEVRGSQRQVRICPRRATKKAQRANFTVLSQRKPPESQRARDGMKEKRSSRR